jgi:hypothetical protein
MGHASSHVICAPSVVRIGEHSQQGQLQPSTLNFQASVVASCYYIVIRLLCQSIASEAPSFCRLISQVGFTCSWTEIRPSVLFPLLQSPLSSLTQGPFWTCYNTPNARKASHCQPQGQARATAANQADGNSGDACVRDADLKPSLEALIVVVRNGLHELLLLHLSACPPSILSIHSACVYLYLPS